MFVTLEAFSNTSTSKRTIYLVLALHWDHLIIVNNMWCLHFIGVCCVGRCIRGDHVISVWIMWSLLWQQVVKSKDGKESETEYFAALVTFLYILLTLVYIHVHSLLLLTWCIGDCVVMSLVILLFQVSALQSTDEECSVTAVMFLLNIITPEYDLSLKLPCNWGK